MEVMKCSNDKKLFIFKNQCDNLEIQSIAIEELVLIEAKKENKIETAAKNQMPKLSKWTQKSKHLYIDVYSQE